MEVERKIENNLVIWKYGRLHVSAAFGQIGASLDEIVEKCQEHALKSIDIEFGELKKEGMQFDHLGAFCFKPIAGILLSYRLVEQKLAINFVTFDENYSAAFIQNISKKFNFLMKEMPLANIETIENNLVSNSIRSYNTIKTVFEEEGLVERFFDEYLYYTFLTKYKNIPKQKAMDFVPKRFGALPI